MSPEYQSSYISYPMVDRTMSILPRQAFQDHGTVDIAEKKQNMQINQQKTQRNLQTKLDSHWKSSTNLEESNRTSPSEYRCQYVKFPIEKAHSIPQITHLKLQGDFNGIAEYRDCYKMYEDYSKSAPIKKADNLNVAKQKETETNAAEYKEKFQKPPSDIKQEKLMKAKNHLHPTGEFTKDLPEYYDSFRDPKIKQMPERGKCREPYLRLKGKLEFNPEYRSTYLDYPRSRPTVKKTTSSFRLPTMSTVPKSPSRSSRRKFKSTSPNHYTDLDPLLPSACQPEYRRAQFNYQIRERTPTREPTDVKKNFSGPTNENVASKNVNKRRTSRHRQKSIMEHNSKSSDSFDKIGTTISKKPVKFGRRSSVLHNAASCRGNSSIIEGNPKYATPISHPVENRTKKGSKQISKHGESFVVLDEPCKKSAWMKKSWYES